MARDNYRFEWSDVAFGSKKPINNLSAYFIAAPREMSTKRFSQLIKEYLPMGNVLLGLAAEPFIAGFEDQPQFKSLDQSKVQAIIDKVNNKSVNHKIYTLRYRQSDLRFILEKLTVKKVILINGSWHYAFHTQAPFYEIAKQNIPYTMVSPFADEQEAKDYDTAAAVKLSQEITIPAPGSKLTELEMLQVAQTIAKHSFDYSFQAGTSVGKKNKDGTYTLLLATYNKVVPYQTYAMHFGASREKNFSPPHDLNHYDTVHAEVAIAIKAQAEGIDLTGSTLFITLLPCPACGRMLGETPITEIVYTADHSNGYAIQILEAAGKKVRRLVPPSGSLST